MPEISYECDSAQGFNFQKDQQTYIGHIKSLKIGSTADTDSDTPADLNVVNPTDAGYATYPVVGVITNWVWPAGHGDPINFKFQISTDNFNTLQVLLQKSLSNTSVKIAYAIFKYDPGSSQYFVCCCGGPKPDQNTPLEGLVEKKGTDLILKLGAQGTNPPSPANWAVELGVMPQPKSQNVFYASAVKKNLTKEWGITVGAKK